MMAAEVELGGEEGRPKVLDADVLIDEILAKKGPQKYRGGLSEETWEQVIIASCTSSCVNVLYYYVEGIRAHSSVHDRDP